MMRRVLRQEWHALRRDGALWLALSVFAMLIGYGVWNGARWAQFQASATPLLAQQKAETRRSNIEFFEMAAKDPRGEFIPWHSGILAFQLWPSATLPLAPLAASAIGQSDLHPPITQARTRFDWALAKEEIDNPVNLLTGRFDLAFVIVYLLPLLILGLCYNVLSGEREGGTLALSLSQPITLQVLAAAKILARAAPVLAVTLGASIFFLVLNGADVASASSRLLMWSAVVVAYAAFWFALAAFVNARGWNSSTNAGALAGAWLALVIVIPSLISASATAAFPAPPRLELTQAIHGADDRAKEHGVQILAAYYRAHSEPMPKNANLDDYWTQRYALDAHMERELAPLLGRVESAASARRKLANRLSFLSPALLAQGALSDIAGSGDARYEMFTRQIDAFRERWRAFFLPRVFAQTGLPLAQWDSVPQWRFAEESSAQVAQRVLPSLLTLAVVTLILSFWSAANLRRYLIAG